MNDDHLPHVRHCVVLGADGVLRRHDLLPMTATVGLRRAGKLSVRLH